MANSGKVVRLNLTDQDGRVYRLQVPPTPKTYKTALPIKEEIIDDEEASVLCSRCSKAFYNHVALRNHLKLQHNVELAELEGRCSPSNSQREPEPGPAPASKPQHTIKLGDISVDPQQLMKLASEKVSYILVKTESLAEKKTSNKKSEKKRRNQHNEFSRNKSETKRPRVFQEEGASPKTSPRKDLLKEREPVELAGPFECLQRSSSVPDAVCHQMFFNCCEYSMHFSREHTRRRKPGFKCQVCEKRLDAQLAGMEEALVDRQCVHCRLLLPDAGALEEHIKAAHVRPKPFKCTVCSKGFTQQGGLQQHMRMHTGDRPFPCSVCAKAFSQKSGLDQHMRTHTKIKPFRCVVCDKSFVQSIHLKQHMRTHTKIAPFQCTLCLSRFKQGSHLKLHLKSHGIEADGVGTCSEVRTSTEIQTEQQQYIVQLQEDSSVYVEESQQEDASVYVEESQEEDASVYLEESLGEDASVEKSQQDDALVSVEEIQEEDVSMENSQQEDASNYVEESQEENSAFCVEENQEEDATVYTEETQEEDPSIYLGENQEDDSSADGEGDQEEEGSDYAEADQEEEGSDYAEEDQEASLLVEDNNMEEEYIIDSSDEMETILS